MPSRRFPPFWSADEADSNLDRRSFIVRDANGQALAYADMPVALEYCLLFWGLGYLTEQY